ncbi:MAG: hypothetical protein R3B47_01735 [Bacteroidia bacterium]
MVHPVRVWNIWTGSWIVANPTSATTHRYPQPVTDVEFDRGYDLGRWHPRPLDQVGRDQASPLPGDLGACTRPVPEVTFSGCTNGLGSWTIENDAQS